MLSYAVRFTRGSLDDIQKITAWIAHHGSIRTAEKFREELQAECRSLEVFPKRGTLYKREIPDVRSIGFRRQVTLLFRVADEKQQVTILRALYRGRHIDEFL